MEISIEQVAQLIGGTVDGDATGNVDRLEKIEEATAGSIAFLANPKYTPYLYTTQASAVIVKKDFEAEKEYTTSLIRVDDPYSSFARLLEAYQQMTAVVKKGIEQPSFQSDSATIGDDTYLGAFSYLGENVKIGNNVQIYPNSHIGDGVEIGDNTIIFAGVKVYANCKIGANCILHSGAVVGSYGFGYAPQEDGSFKAIPQTGNVIIEDNVDIGANTTIDCATMGSTIIRSGAKLDNLVQVAHNVEIGKNNAIASQAGISGSAKLGQNVQVGGQAGITGHLTLADKTIIGPQAGVPKTITEEGKVWFGSPIMEHREFLKSSIILRKLPNLIQRVKDLEKKL
ncbi:UDP-3-O-(3-hydroxymyristoyl)glucosamine N-acyltransferase [Roseivirga sp.]|uniref:UDP-3-O-(3-hydroxymyristoyl)glucosamine N-acyltransferase n=1 Tax=Roseivirga sp. TaxID=1964215 RepID=UPI003B8E45F0